MKNINEQILRIKTIMGLNEENPSGSVSQNPTGAAKRKWESGINRNGPAPGSSLGNEPSKTRTVHGRANPIELAETDEKEKTSFEDFSEKRLGGAEKIADNAKEKGGVALLTYHHFEVKLPYYEKAAKGELDMENAKKEYKNLLEKLYSSTKDSMDIEQIPFQELVGKIEVLGELIIKNSVM